MKNKFGNGPCNKNYFFIINDIKDCMEYISIKASYSLYTYVEDKTFINT